MKQPISVGLFAHVDAGKTSLAEAILKTTGAIRKAGRVDEGTSLLDHNRIERRRGITIFSKTASFSIADQPYILVDTPGHKDFASEAERCLAVLDAAILLIDAGDGPVGYTKTLWSLLRKARIPLFLFVNKMDRGGSEKELMEAIQSQLDERAVSFSLPLSQRMEAMALADPSLMESYFALDTIPLDQVEEAIRQNRLFPVFFGSALSGDGVEALLDQIAATLRPLPVQGGFRAICYKIGYDGEIRLSQIRLLSGTLRVKQLLGDEKIHEIRRYQGQSYEHLDAAGPGALVSLVGPEHFHAGQVWGDQPQIPPTIRPVLRYEVRRTDGGEEEALLRQLKRLEEEEPSLALQYEAEDHAIQLSAMGRVMLEVLEERLAERGIAVQFTPAAIRFQETIQDSVVGIGHFEPLRHYAEVKLRLEPAPRGSGNYFSSALQDSNLRAGDIKTVEAVLQEPIPGVLLGEPLTDIHFILEGLLTGPHTSGGDLPEATRRAVRQGLMQASSIILEPTISFELNLPLEGLGRILQELTRRSVSDLKQTVKGERVLLSGRGRLRQMRDFLEELDVQTSGQAQLFLSEGPPTNAEDPEALLLASTYDPLKDANFPPSSIFCHRGAGIAVAWQEVSSWAHLPSDQEKAGASVDASTKNPPPRSAQALSFSIDRAEMERIFQETFFANANRQKKDRKEEAQKERQSRKTEKKQEEGSDRARPLPPPGQPSWLLVDGYNVLHAWPGLLLEKEDAFESGRKKLMDMLAQLQALSGWQVILVFDAYRVSRTTQQWEDRSGLHVVYTKQAETADQYIARYSKEKAGKKQVIVATSDGPIQLIAWKEGAFVLSARELLQYFQTLESKSKRFYDQAATEPLGQRLGDLLEKE